MSKKLSGANKLTAAATVTGNSTEETQQTHSDDVTQFSDEHMNVRLTIYALNGIKRRHDMKSKPDKRKSKHMSKTQRPVPTTAVVSIARSSSNTGFIIHTYLPSRELICRKSNKDGNEERCTAYWRGQESTDSLSIESFNPSTLAMTLTMKREGCCNDMNARLGLLYSHESIDVKVDIGKGKEIISLGVASIVVSGEEEGEVVANVPVKAVAKDKQNRQTAVGHIKKTRKSFADDSFIYDLDESTTLRVGVQIIPKQEIRLDPPARKGGLNPTNTNTTLEESDDNSLHKQPELIEKKDTENKKKDTENNSIIVHNVQTKAPSFLASFFCGGLPLCIGPSADDENKLLAGALPGAKPILTCQRAAAETQILPSYLLSDVSSKTFETWELTAFGDATADAQLGDWEKN